ncbi:TonB-dependent receptor [Arenibacter sp. F26102]|uniref:SusC/RagA family TonB-linked outer membrane protein n=1 Tax=Arenibacter sp. F26102 TaxID=2926416 RepID=UPI001FF64F77|nr:TonB-dependent receptor [Arenibacter sp. F26102]MCK0146480.1 TonB-dependent receptor [Arenibacter sp. F26102]
MKFKLTKRPPCPLGKVILHFFMKSVIFLFCAISFALTPLNGEAQDAEIIIDTDMSLTIRQAFRLINKQTDYKFIYRHDQIKTAPNIDLKKGVIKAGELLDKCLSPISFTYNFTDGGTIVVKKKSANTSISGSTKLADQNVQFQVSGTVTDKEGVPLPGASIVEKGTINGTQADFDGNFYISVADENSILEFSYVGFATEEVPINGKAIVTVSLLESASNLDEVVVVGYGTVKRSDLTGSVGSVKMPEMNKAPVTSFDDALAGRVAGVSVISGDGQPGTLPEIVIRGGNSLTQSNSPLYVVDGFPLEDNDNSSINPSDIESIDILKDASATAIYGARGANGVIMITTKSGKEGVPTISFDRYYGLQDDIKRIETMDPYDFAVLQLEIDPLNSPYVYLEGPGRTLEDYKTYEKIDWYDKVLRTGAMQSNNLSISGGSGKTKYYMSGSYLEQEGIFINTGFERYQGRISLDQELTNKLKARINVNYSNTKNYGVIATNNGGSTSASLMYSIWSYRPVTTAFDVDLEEELNDPEVNPATDYRVNPVLEAENVLRESISQNLLGNASLEYSIIKGLKFRMTGGASDNLRQSNSFYNSQTRNGGPNHPSSKGPNGSQSYYRSTTFSNENLLTYSNRFNKTHSLTVLAGYSQQKNKSSLFGGQSVQITDEELGLSGLDVGTPTSISASSSNWALQSFFGRLNYDYKSKYIFTATVRADGSSKFAPKNRWGYFPSAALAYRLSQESFMKPIEFVSNAKVRIGYGVTGNNRVSDFAYLSGIGTANWTGYSFGNENPTRGTFVSGLDNADLKWESTSQLNFGLDLGFFDNRISFTGDYYYKETKDLLLNAQVPYATGFSTAYKNIGAVSNEGVEFALNTVNIDGENFTWKSDFNISFNRSKVLALVDNQSSLTSTTFAVYNSNPSYIAQVGEPVALFYGVLYEGLYQYEDFNQLTNGNYSLKDEIPGNGSARGNILPGYAKYTDIDGDGNISLNDYTVMGNPNPDFVGGFNNSFTYKNLDLSFFFQFSYGNEIMNANRVVFEGTFLTGRNQYATYTDRWTEENPTSDIPRAKGEPAFFSSRIVEDGSFLRLKTASLGYTIPSEFLKELGIKSFRTYVSGQNIFTWTGYSGVDPEVSTRNSALTPGFDYSPYPRQRTLITGINITF